MMASHFIILSSNGEAVNPSGLSSYNFLKSLNNLLLAAVVAIILYFFLSIYLLNIDKTKTNFFLNFLL